LVEALDSGGDVLPGYEAESCVALRGNETAQPVVWAKHGRLPAGSLVLRFVFQGPVQLFSFSVRPDDPPSHRLALDDELASPTAAGSWRLTFSDEFDEPELNSSRWTVADGGTHGEQEIELYTAEDVSVQDGVLAITTRWNPTDCVPANGSSAPGLSDGHGWCINARPAPADGGAGPPGTRRFDFTSGWLDTEMRFAQRFGRFSVRAKLPDVQATNIWPAHWLLPDQSSPDCKAGVSHCACCWPEGGEIDIMESCKCLQSNC